MFSPCLNALQLPPCPKTRRLGLGSLETLTECECDWLFVSVCDGLATGPDSSPPLTPCQLGLAPVPPHGPQRINGKDNG